MNSAITIRRARDADLDPLLDVLEDILREERFLSGELPLDREDRLARWREQISNHDSVMYVACDRERPVGEIAVIDRSDYGATFGMMLHASYRGRGIGSRLLEAAIAWTRARGFNELSLLVFAHNTSAIGLYEKYGFVQADYYPRDVVRKSGEAWDTILMKKQLKPG